MKTFLPPIDDPWLPALECLLDAKGAELPRHAFVKAFMASVVSIRARTPRCKKAQCTPEQVLRSGRLDLLAEIGGGLVSAWINRDVDLFSDMDRIMRNLIHSRARIRRGGPASRRLIEIACRLRDDLSRDPFREEVIEECERVGVTFQNWADAFRNGRLAFLRYRAERRGKRKPKRIEKRGTRR